MPFAKTTGKPWRLSKRSEEHKSVSDNYVAVDSGQAKRIATQNAMCIAMLTENSAAQDETPLARMPSTSLK